MAIIFSYSPIQSTDVTASDRLILSQMNSDGNPTRSITIGELSKAIAGGAATGGPYLPLTAGPTVPLTGDLYMAPNGAGPSVGSKNIVFRGIDDNGSELDGGRIFTVDSTINPSGQDLYFQNANDAGVLATNLMIDAFGSVGIGTTSPSYTLDVNGTGNFATTLNVGGNVQFGGATDFRYFQGSNSIGLGTSSPNFKFDISGGDLRFENNDGIRFGGTGSNNTNWRIYTTGALTGTLEIGNQVSSPRITIYKSGLGTPTIEGKIQFNLYGSGNFTGTAAYNLSVDANGNIIETSTSSSLPWDYEYDAANENFVQGEAPNIAGTGNTGYGVGSLPILDTGQNNTAFGANTGLNLENSSDNVMIGYDAGRNFRPGGSTCDRNTVVGSGIIFALNPQGDDNTCVGYRAGSNIDSGSFNVFVGSDAGRINTLGTDNVAIGRKALETQTGSSRNVAIGSLALTAAQTGATFNTAIGYAAGTAITTGDNNVLLGYQAGNAITQASFNTLIGYEVAQAFVLGESNTYVGRQAGSNANGGSFNIAIGATATLSVPGISNEVNIHNNSITARFQGAAAAWSFVSDARDKKDIEDLELGVEFINKLKPRKFKWDLRDSDVDKNKEASGFVAQEIQEILDETGINYTDIVDTNNPDQYTVAKANIIPMLVKAVQELSAEVKMLKNK